MFNLPYEGDTPFYEGDKTDESLLTAAINKTKVYTILFQLFVFMQIFNQINSRKLGDDLNVFANFFNNFIFLGIIVFTFVVQILLVQYGGIAVRCYPISWAQQGFCLGVAAFGLVWGILIKILVPDRYFHELKVDEEPVTEEEAKSSVMAMRKNTIQKVSLKRSQSSQKEVSQATNSLTSIIRQRSTIRRRAGIKADEKMDESTPATNKLIGMLRGTVDAAKKNEETQLLDAPRINESEALNAEQEVKAGSNQID